MSHLKEKNELKKAGFTIIEKLRDPLGRNAQEYGYFGKVEHSSITLPDYQRKTDKSHIARIKKEFQIQAALPLVISFRDMKLNIVDKNHLMRAMGEIGASWHYAICLTNLTYAKEAGLFLTLNDVTKKMNGWKKFSAGLRAKRPANKILLQACKNRKLTTPLNVDGSYSKYSAVDSDISSPIMLWHPLNKGGIKMLELVLDIYDQCFRLEKERPNPVAKEAKDCNMIRGLCSFLNEYHFTKEELTWDVIKTTLVKNSPREIVITARIQKAVRRIDSRQYHDALCTIFKL